MLLSFAQFSRARNRDSLMKSFVERSSSNSRMGDLEQISLGLNREDSQGFVNEGSCRH
jgi:hypothetical protein